MSDLLKFPTKKNSLSMLRVAAWARVLGEHAKPIAEPVANALTALHYSDSYYRDQI